MRASIILLSLLIVISVVFARGSTTPQILAITCQSLETMSMFQLDSISVNGTKTEIGNLTHVGGIIPGTAAYMPDKGSVEFLSLCDSPGDCAAVVDAKTDKLLNWWQTPVTSNLAYDIGLNKTYVNSFVNNTNYAGELDASGVVHLSAKLPGIINVACSTYCPVGHIFFLTEQTRTKYGLGNNLVRVDTQKSVFLDKVPVNDSMEIIMWDYMTATMYAWVTTEDYAGELVTLNITSGERLKTIVSFPTLSANGGSAVLDLQNGIVYSVLLDIAKSEINPLWVVVDVNTGKYTQSKLTYYAVGLTITGYN